MSGPTRSAPLWQGHHARRGHDRGDSIRSSRITSLRPAVGMPHRSREGPAKATPLRGEKETGWARAPPRARLTTTPRSPRGPQGRGGSDRSRSGTGFSRRLLIRRDRHLACGAPAKADREARQRPRRAVAPRWGDGTRSERGKGARQRGAPRSSAITRPVSSGTGRVRSIQRGLTGFEAPVSCSATCLRVGEPSRASSESSAPGFRQSCPKQARLQHLDRVGGCGRKLAANQRGQECHAWKPSR